jgi:hypothetical protein
MGATSSDKATAADKAVANVPPKRHTEATSPWDVTVPLGLLGVVGFLSWAFVASAFARDRFKLDNDGSVQAVAIGVALAAMGVILWGIRLADEGRPSAFQRLRDRTMLALGLCGVFAYFNFGHLHFGGFVHVWDTYHYYVGAKYFREVGYERMYDCAAVVDAENGRLAEVQRRNHTDLRTNLIVPTKEVVENADQICKQYFTPERWGQYTRDINSLRSMVNEGRWKEIHLDHGYNATPVWTLAGQFFANLRPATSDGLIHVNLLDPLYIFLTMLMVWWAFGARGFALAGIVLGCNFPNRYYWTGGAFLRHDWLFYLVASVCLLKKDKPILGGLSFSYTVLLRLFPGLAAIGPAIAAVEYFRQNRKLDPAFVKYLIGGAVGTAVLVGASFLLLPHPPPNTLQVALSAADSGATKLVVSRVDRETGQPTSWLKGPNLFPSSSLPGLTTMPLESGSGFYLAGVAGTPEGELKEPGALTVKIGGDETITVPVAPGDPASAVAERVKAAFEAKVVRDGDGSGFAMWKRFAANTVKHASTPLTNLMGLKTILTYRPSTVGSQLSDRLLIDAWKPWKDMKIQLWNEMKPVWALLVLGSMVLVYFALRHHGPKLYVAACLGVGFCVVGAELTNYYYCFLLCMAALYAEKREAGLLLAGLSVATLIINFGFHFADPRPIVEQLTSPTWNLVTALRLGAIVLALIALTEKKREDLFWGAGVLAVLSLIFTFSPAQARDLDQQYTAMSYASVLGMWLVWFSFTKWASTGSAPPEPDAGPSHRWWALGGIGLMSLFVLNEAVNKAWGAPIGDSGFGVRLWVLAAIALFAGVRLAQRFGAPAPALATAPEEAPVSRPEKKKGKKR